MVNLEEVTQFYPVYQDTILEVLVLDICEPDTLDVWRSSTNLFPQVTFLWGVVDSIHTWAETQGGEI